MAAASLSKRWLMIERISTPIYLLLAELLLCNFCAIAVQQHKYARVAGALMFTICLQIGRKVLDFVKPAI